MRAKAERIEEGYYHGGVVKGVSGGGNYSLQAKTFTPTKTETVVSSDAGYYGLSSVTVNPIPDLYQDVSSVTATAGNVLAGKVIVESDGSVTTGTMTNRGAVNKTLDTATTSYTVPAGYHSGSGKVQISVETATATPTGEVQTITPTEGKVLRQVTVNAIPSNYADATGKTATAAQILSGQTAVSWDSTTNKPVSVAGTMTDRGAVSQPLNAGGSYTIPAGYHNGSGKITANSLASQTKPATGKTAVAAAQMLTGYSAWVNGTQINGSMANNGAVSGTITGLGAVTGDTSFTIPAGYTSGGTVSITGDIEAALAAI